MPSILGKVVRSSASGFAYSCPLSAASSVVCPSDVCHTRGLAIKLCRASPSTWAELLDELLGLHLRFWYTLVFLPVWNK